MNTTTMVLPLLAALCATPALEALSDDPAAAAEAAVQPRTNLSGCVQGQLAGWKVPEPPQAPFWVKVAVNLKRK